MMQTFEVARAVVHLFLNGQNEREQDGREQLWLVFQTQQLQHRKAGFAIEGRVRVEVFAVRPQVQ
jgi:hypothetical protein